jgi:hypothetical protein
MAKKRRNDTEEFKIEAIRLIRAIIAFYVGNVQ